VRRSTGPWTPAVHALLRHLKTTSFDGAPRVLGIDAQRREVLTYVPGHVPRAASPDLIPGIQWEALGHLEGVSTWRLRRSLWCHCGR
jgi:hypothetical protein